MELENFDEDDDGDRDRQRGGAKTVAAEAVEQDKSASTSANGDEKTDGAGYEDAEKKPKLFEGKKPIEKAWWLQKVLFTWVNPLMAFTQKHGELKFENYGDIREKDKVDR